MTARISKVLVANRGEIAIRAFRAAYEMGIATVAVYPHEDRNSLHRLKADESYQIGDIGHPVRAYLSVDEMIRVATLAGADAVYPGYGFLSENPELAAACAAAGITFVGPSADVLELTGNKARAIAAARAAGLPVLASSAPSASVDELVHAARDMEFPLFVKAVSGGGGRGMRRVTDRAALAEAIEAASREAESAFGDPTVYLEQAVINPRHIEVQILADTDGNVMHLFERDCSVQRRHQKVIELAPAPNLPEELRQKICDDAVAFARGIDYSCAGTVEFLLDERGHHVFIECNPRIQVEHTVTEEITDVDLVASQLRIAAGETLAELGLSQESLVIRGCSDAVPDHHRRPGQRLPPRHRTYHRLPLPGRRGHPARRGRAPRRRDRCAFRFDAGQTHLPGKGFQRGGGPRVPGTGRVPGPRGINEHSVPAGGDRRSRLPGGPDHHLVHRRPALPADGALARRPRHQDPQLPRRSHGQPAARSAPVHRLPAGQAAADRTRHHAAARQQAPALRSRTRGVRPVDA